MISDMVASLANHHGLSPDEIGRMTPAKARVLYFRERSKDGSIVRNQSSGVTAITPYEAFARGWRGRGRDEKRILSRWNELRRLYGNPG